MGLVAFLMKHLSFEEDIFPEGVLCDFAFLVGLDVN
jgi:hypothetical protein